MQAARSTAQQLASRKAMKDNLKFINTEIITLNGTRSNW
jgi:hypothetical protein